VEDPLKEPACGDEDVFIPPQARPDVVSDFGTRAWLVAEALLAFERTHDAADTRRGE